MEIVMMFLIGFGIIGSIEARLRTLQRRQEARHARLEGKVDALLRHAGLTESEQSVISELERQNAG